MARLPFNPDNIDPPPEHERPRREPTGRTSQPLSVCQLAARIKQVLNDGFDQSVRVVGEISNLSTRHHWFFSLKDQHATLRCVCFASNARRISTPVEDGMQVVLSGRVDFYDAQGNVQLYVTRIEPVGQGALELKLRQLIEQLRQQGYFDEAHKKPLPAFPQRIAVLSSRGAAAWQDVIQTARQRWAGCELALLDVPVQGAQAAPRIAQAIRQLSAHGRGLNIDAILLTRGGGSIEDLWAFNERELADAIYDCTLPVVAAIGHETDVTVAELVADVRASTPTQAAMRLIPQREALEQELTHWAGRLEQALRRRIEHEKHRLGACGKRAFFLRPLAMVQAHRQRVDQLQRRLGRALPQRLGPAHQQLEQNRKRLCRALPGLAQQQRQTLDRLAQRLGRAMDQHLARQRQQLQSRADYLEAVNPKRVLDRGYSYTLGPDGKLLRDPAQVRAGDGLTTVLARGRVRSRVSAAEDASASKPAAGKPARRSRSASRDAEQGGLFEASDD